MSAPPVSTGMGTAAHSSALEARRMALTDGYNGYVLGVRCAQCCSPLLGFSCLQRQGQDEEDVR